MFSLNSLIRPNILALKPYKSARSEYSQGNGVFLDANENPFGSLNRYPDPLQGKLKSKLASMRGVDENQIFIGNGSDEVIDLAFRIFCEPGKDKVLTFSPTYGMYQVSADINNVDQINIPLKDDFQIDIDPFMASIAQHRPKLIFICSPNNPTGNIIDVASIEQILKVFNGVLIIDEAYIDFTNHSSWINRLNTYPNLIVCQTFSKAWGLASSRLGVAYASEGIITLFNSIKPPYNVSQQNQEAGHQALQHPEEFEYSLNLILSERQKLVSELLKLELIVKVYPSETNFLLVEMKESDIVYHKLIDQGIITRNRTTEVQNCLRITVGSPAENSQLLSELKKMKL